MTQYPMDPLKRLKQSTPALSHRLRTILTTERVAQKPTRKRGWQGGKKIFCKIRISSGLWTLCVVRKSTTISLVLSRFTDRLLTLHQVISCCISSLYDDSSFLPMRPTTVLSLANLMMWFESCSAVQLWNGVVRSVNSSGLSTQP